MATSPFPGVSSPNTNLTGNAVYVTDSSGNLWMVAEDSAAGGAAIFKSTNNGINWSQMATVPSTTSAKVALDPAVAIDSSNNLHFIGQVISATTITLVKYEFNTTSSTLTGPFNIVLNGVIGADYDIVALSNGNCYLVSCAITATQELIQGLEIDASGTTVFTDAIVTQAFGAGSRYGSVTLYSPDGATVEIYLGSHPKVVTFQDMTVTISLYTRTSPDTVSAVTMLTLFDCRHVDNRLTVIGSGQARYLSQCYYTQQTTFLAGNVLLGYLASSSSSWLFQSITGTPKQSYVEPTLSLSSNGLVLGFLQKDFTRSPAVDSPIVLWDVTPAGWLTAARTDFIYNANATFLRGSKSTLPTAMPWGFLATQSSDLTSRFFTGYNPPPTVTLSPNTLTAHRGVTYNFDASGSFSPNEDVLRFAWTIDDPTTIAVFKTNGSQATLNLPLAAGPDEIVITVTVTVTAFDQNGNQLHTGVSQTSTATYPAVAPPVITSASAQDVARNAEISFTPTVTDADGDVLSYSWIQPTGTPLNMVSDPDELTLVFDTNGAAIGGEAIVFELTVSDGMNDPVSESFTFNVAARASSGETKVWNRASFSGNISERNTAGSWGSPAQVVTSATAPIVTQFVSNKRGALIGGGQVLLFISPKAVFVQVGDVSPNANGYHVYLPDTTDTILDAIHSDEDATIVLTAGAKLQRFLPNSTLADTDFASETLLLSTVTAKSYTSMQITPSFGGNRVAILYGTHGVLLIQLNTKTLVVTGTLEIAMETNFLFGSDKVVFVRSSELESLHEGELLVGTVDTNGNTYETTIALGTRAVTKTFDSASLTNPTVATGEILFLPNDSYAGQPLAPSLQAPTQAGTSGCLLTWQQARTDLVTGYYVFMSTEGGAFTLTAIVNSGLNTTVSITGLLPGKTYSFKVQALSNDGASPFSSTQQISL